MMTLLVFEVILFGLFGMLLGQFLGQSREAYAIWIREIVYTSENVSPKDETDNSKRKLCSNMESLAREICALIELICVVTGLIILSFFIIFLTVIFTYDSIIGQTERNFTIASTILAGMLVIVLPIILYKININLFDKQISSQIDDKIFDVWHASNCQKCKNKLYRTKLQPAHLYEILDEKIKLNKITPTKEEIEIIKLFNKDKKDVNHQS